MKNLLFLLLSLATFGQKSVVEINTPGSREIVLTRPTFSAKPEPIPKENGLYRFTHFMSASCKDGELGETYAPHANIYAAVGMGGQGLILNDKTKRIHLVFTITDARKQSGCQLLAFYPKARQFSGAGHKAMGDIMMPKLAESQREQEQAMQQQAADDNQEEDVQIRALLAQKRKLQADLQKKAMDGMANAALFNDMAEITRNANKLAAETDNEYQLANIELSIEERRLQIQLANMQGEGAAEERDRIRRKLACIPRQRDIFTRQRSELNALKKKYPKPEDAFDYMEKAGEVKGRYMMELTQSCPEN